MVRDEGTWRVRWSPSAPHPRLGGASDAGAVGRSAPAGVGQRGQRELRFRRRQPVLATSRRGAPAGTRWALVKVVADVLRQFDDTLNPQRLRRAGTAEQRSDQPDHAAAPDHDTKWPVSVGRPARKSSSPRRPKCRRPPTTDRARGGQRGQKDRRTNSTAKAPAGASKRQPNSADVDEVDRRSP